jgi:hypothetical protein
MGAVMDCYNNNLGSEPEFKVNVSPEQLPRIIALQSILRGYLDRWKTVEFTHMRFINAERKRKLGKINASKNKK